MNALVPHRRRAMVPYRAVSEQTVLPPRPLVAHQIGMGMDPKRYAEREGPETIQMILDRVGWYFHLPTVCVVDGLPVLREEWSTRVIPEGKEVRFISRPRGGNNSTLALGAMLAVAIAAALVAGPFAIPLFGGLVSGTILGVSAVTIVGAIAGATIAAGGSLLVSAFLMPEPGAADSGLNSGDPPPALISAQRNTARPFDPIIVSYGETMIVPDIAAQPYSEFHENKQRVYTLYCLGLGKYNVKQIRGEDTKIWDDSGGVAAAFEGDLRVEICAPGEEVTLFPFSVVTNDLVSNLTIPGANADGNWGDYTAEFFANPPGTLAKRLVVDVIFPGGIYQLNNSGKPGTQHMQVEAYYREVNDSGANLGEWTKFVDRSYSKRVREALRFTYSEDVNPGRYKVRMRRKNKELSGDKGMDQCVWYALRAHLKDDKSFPDTTMIALQYDADGEDVAETMQSRINVIAQRRIQARSGGGWSLQATRSPVWAALDVWTNSDYGAGQDRDTTLDLDTFEYYADLATDREDYFDHTFRQGTTVLDAMNACLRVMRSRVVFLGSKLSMVRDEPRAVPTMMLTDREIVRGSYEEKYIAQKPETADDVIVQFFNNETYEADEVRCTLKNSTSRKPAYVSIPGITSREHAWREGMYLAKHNQVRRIFPGLATEHDGRLLKFGDWVRVVSEIPEQYGETSAVIDYDVNTRRLTLDLRPTWGAEQRYVLLRRRDGRPFGPVKCSQGATREIAILAAGDLADVEAEQGITLADVLDREPGSDPPSASFGTAGRLDMEAVVMGLDPSGEQMRVAFMLDDISVHEIDGTEVIPTPNDDPVKPPNRPALVGLRARINQHANDSTLDVSWMEAWGAKRYVVEASFEANDDDADRTWVEVFKGERLRVSVPLDGEIATKVRAAAIGKFRGDWQTVNVSFPEYLTLIPTFTLTPLIATGSKKDKGPFIRVEWDKPNRGGYEGVLIEWWPVGDTSQVKAKTVRGAGRVKVDIFEGILRETDFKFQLSYLFRGGLEGNPSPTQTVTAGKTFDPANFPTPTFTSVTPQTSSGSGGTEYSFFKLIFADPNDNAVKGIVLYYKKSTENWEDAVEKEFKSFAVVRLTEGIHRRQDYDFRAQFFDEKGERGNLTTYSGNPVSANDAVNEVDVNAGPNRAFNGSFERIDATTGTGAAGWLAGGSSGFSRGTATGIADHGEAYMQRVFVSGDTNPTANTADDFYETAYRNETWILQFVMRRIGTTSFTAAGIRMLFRDKDGVILGSGTFTASVSTLSTTFADLEVVGTAPAGTASVSLRLFVTSHSSGTVVWDSVKLRRQNDRKDIKAAAISGAELDSAIALPDGTLVGTSGELLTETRTRSMTPADVINLAVDQKINPGRIKIRSTDGPSTTSVLSNLIDGDAEAIKAEKTRLKAGNVATVKDLVDNDDPLRLADDVKMGVAGSTKTVVTVAGWAEDPASRVNAKDTKVRGSKLLVNTNDADQTLDQIFSDGAAGARRMNGNKLTDDTVDDEKIKRIQRTKVFVEGGGALSGRTLADIFEAGGLVKGTELQNLSLARGKVGNNEITKHNKLTDSDASIAPGITETIFDEDISAYQETNIIAVFWYRSLTGTVGTPKRANIDASLIVNNQPGGGDQVIYSTSNFTEREGFFQCAVLVGRHDRGSEGNVRIRVKVTVSSENARVEDIAVVYVTASK